ncbi:hypothetical protein I4U23_022836 [Adineta vaga]|nr:hypothetical protein I4U23_022836 [Adineta vaga]
MSESEMANVTSSESIERSLKPITSNALVKTFQEDVADEHIQKIIRQEMQVKDLPISKELEEMRIESRNAHLSTKFQTDREHEQSTFIVNSVDAWIDTAVDSLHIAAHASAMVSLLGDVLDKHGVESIPPLALTHGRGLHDRTVAIYSRSIQQAFAATRILLHEIDKNDNTRNNPAVNKAKENYERNCLRYKDDEIDIKEVVAFHSQLVQKIEEAEPDETTKVRKEAKKSSKLWKIVLVVGAIVAAAAIVVGGAVVIGIALSKK